MVCGASNIELHHLDEGNRGRADNRVVPLCPIHHRIDKLSAHGFDAKKFKEIYMEEMEETAATLFNMFKDGLML